MTCPACGKEVTRMAHHLGIALAEHSAVDHPEVTGELWRIWNNSVSDARAAGRIYERLSGLVP